MMGMIDAAHLAKRIGPDALVQDLSFSVAAGEVFGLLGANGAGKTTTVRMLAGLLRPTSGTATIAGHDVVRERRAVVRSAGVVFELPALYPRLTVEENLRMAAALRGLPRLHISAALEQFDLQQYRHRAVRGLSKGWRQRTMLARALLGRPPVLFLDEPTSGLDPHAAAAVYDTLRALRHAGVAILLTTHDMVEAATLCDRVGILDRGTLVALDAPAALIDRLPHRTVRIHWWESGVLRQGEARLGDPGTMEFIQQIVAQHRVLQIETTGTLDDVYRRFTRRQEA